MSDNIGDYPDGIVIPVDKPYMWTSADVVRKLKFRAQRHFHLKNIKIGHAGTLDPLATGILLVCIGKATKVAEELQGHPKQYEATVRLGAVTPSFDAEKPISGRFPYEHITKQKVEEALREFEGTIEQIPPVFSAKNVDGKRSYEIAREGIEAVLKPSVVTIHSLELLSFEPFSQEKSGIDIKRKELYTEAVQWEMTDLPSVSLRISCSKGTYIRSIARDLGLSLESGGYLTALRRTRSGEFDVENSLDFEQICSLF